MFPFCLHQARSTHVDLYFNTLALLADLLASLIVLMLNGNANGAMAVAVAFSRIYFDYMDLVKCIRDKDISISTDTRTFTHNDSTRKTNTLRKQPAVDPILQHDNVNLKVLR